jgi:hypothetical protein
MDETPTTLDEARESILAQVHVENARHESAVRLEEALHEHHLDELEAIAKALKERADNGD